MTDEGGGWLARLAKGLGSMVGGTRGGADGDAAHDRADDFWCQGGHNGRRGADVAASAPPPTASPERSGIRRDDNGRYLVAGWTFATLDQALEFETERAAATGGGTQAEHAARVSPTLPTPDIRRNAAGCYVVGGWTFPTLEQALEFNAGRAPVQASAAPTITEPLPRPAPKPAPTAVASAPARLVVPSTKGREPPRWIADCEALSAGGVGFEANMIYFGTSLRHDPRHDQSRIDPTLKVDPRGDPTGATLGYWPSYLEADPRARATYLTWLSGGRRAAPMPSGYLFVFLYGLEQRLLVDNARADAPAIFAELRRLVALHDQDHSFQAYASKLLALSALYEDEDGAPATAECARNWDVELPLDLRIRLGRRLRDGRPFDADDALRWVLALPDVHLRTTGQRCFGELRDLWSARFAARHPRGLSVRRPKKTLRHEYRAASGKFNVDLSVDELPDVSGISAPLAPLRAMLDLCLDDLSAFSRLVGRDPAARGRLHAEVLLPAELRGTSPALTSCRKRLEDFTGGERCGVSTAEELARLLDLDVDWGADKLPTATMRQIGTALDALGHGFEPDRRYGPASTMRSDMPMAVFPACDGGAVDHERQAYADARMAMEVAVLAAASDGEVVAAELDAVERRLRAAPDLAEHEIARLVAASRALAADPPKVRAAMKRLADAPAPVRASIASAAVEAVLADGMVQPGEVKFLETLHETLGLPASALYAALHRGAEDAGPVLVEAGRPEQGVVPIPPEPMASSLTIDAARLARIQGETTRVSALLATIFVDEEPEAPEPAKPVPRAASGFDGLDGPHSELLTRLLAGPLERDVFDAAATALRLMPDGAVETINEWGFDRFGEPVLEDDDAVRVLPDMMDQIMPMGGAA